MRDTHVPVLIVGGGPTGLAASLLLSRLAVPSLLIERHFGTSVHPKARGLNVRTMELLRVWGLEPSVRSAASELERAVDVVWAPTLTAAETRRMRLGGAGEVRATDSPTSSAGCLQSTLEKVLLEATRSYAAGDLRFGQELTALSQDSDGVTATVIDRANGDDMIIRGDWVIAADGAHSTVRALLGVGMVGPGPLFHRMAIYFRADLREVGAARPALVYVVSPEEGAGVFGAVNLADLWVYMAPYDPDRGQRPEDFTAEHCVHLVRGAVGLQDLEVEVLSAVPWSGAAAIADRFREGRVFLAGDAAHLIPAAGGQAMNVGIQDVHNLAWKLAGRIGGWAAEGLLDTYEAERRPFAMAINDDVARNVAAGPGAPRLEQFSNRGRVLGVSYASSAVVPDGRQLPCVGNPVVEYVPTARPGSRAPHVWLWRGDRRISALDLFDSEFVLLTGAAGRAWCDAGEQVANCLGVPLRCWSVGPEGPLIDRTGTWLNLYGIGADGAVLVRPDGHVAWRANTVDGTPATRLADVFCRILSIATTRRNRR